VKAVTQRRQRTAPHTLSLRFADSTYSYIHVSFTVVRKPADQIGRRQGDAKAAGFGASIAVLSSPFISFYFFEKGVIIFARAEQCQT